MKKILSLLVILLAGFLYSCKTEKKEAALSVPFEKYTLANGLTVVLHEDKSDPIAAVAVVFHVGSSR